MNSSSLANSHGERADVGRPQTRIDMVQLEYQIRHGWTIARCAAYAQVSQATIERRLKAHPEWRAASPPGPGRRTEARRSPV